MADWAGEQLGQYRLQRLLGKGGFAEVYLGEHIYLDKQAAVKVLLAHLSQQERQRFVKEAQTLAKLTHQHIVKVLDFGVQAETPYLVMDYAPNGTMRDNYPGNQPLPLEKVLAYLKQTAAALHYVHNQKLIHRDIKPGNMLLGPDDEILLSDFGIAVIAQNTSRQSAQGFAGTPAYMAPEQINRQAVPASDQYALAVVVYEWLTGTPPFEGSQVEVIGKQLYQPPPPLRERVPDISPAIEEVVLTALEKKPEDRYGSVRAFANAFEQAYLLSRRISAPAPDVPPITPTPKPPEPARISAPPAPAPTEVVPAERRPSGEPFQPTMQQPAEPPSNPFPAPAEPKPAPPGDTPPPTPKAPARPAGGISRRTVLIAGCTVGGLIVIGTGVGLATAQNWLHASASASPTHTASPTPTVSPTPIPGPGTTLFVYRGNSNAVYGVAWSPNGKRIASACYDETVQVWDATTGGNVFIYRGHVSPAFFVAWSPDGQRLASASEDKTVQVWDAGTGGNVYAYRGHSDWVHPVAWSPNGQRIASGGGDETVQVWDATDGGNVYTYRGHNYPVFSVAWSPDGQRIASASGDRTVQVWDASNGGNVYTYRGHASPVFFVAWSPDGQRITSGSEDGTAQVWDAGDGGNPYIYRGHANVVRSVAWSPDSKYIASSSGDRTVQVWDAGDGRNLYIYSGHSDSVEAVAWSPDGKYIASGSMDHTVQVWIAPR